MSDIRNVQPEAYFARIVFYVQGARDANIIFTVTNHPNFELDNVYEFGMLLSYRHNLFEIANICEFVERFVNSTKYIRPIFTNVMFGQFLIHLN